MNSTASPTPSTTPTLADLQIGDTVTVRCNPAHFIFTDEDLAEADTEGRDLTLLSSTAVIKEVYPDNTVRAAIDPKYMGNVYRCSDGIEVARGYMMISIEDDNTATETAGRYAEQNRRI